MLDYKPIFEKYRDRLYAHDTTKAKLDISYYFHFPKPEKLEYDKAYSYLFNEFKRIEAKELYDFEYSFNMIQDELGDFIVFINEYQRAFEMGGAELSFFVDYWNNENLEILEYSLSEFKKIMYTLQPLQSKLSENNLPNTKRIMNFHLILFNALTENQKQKTSFQSYFKREAKIAKRDNFVEFHDYFSGCQYVLKSYENEILRQYNKRLTENNLVVSSVKSGNGIKFGNEIVTDETDKRIIDSLHRIAEDAEYVKSLGYVNNIDYVCYLTDMGEITTNIWEKKSEQKLYWQDIAQIEQGVNSAKDELSVQDQKNIIETKKTKFELTEFIINVDTLSLYFKSSFRGIGENNLNHFETLIKDIETLRKPIEFAEVALMIHESNFVSNRMPINFSDWYPIFCNCIGCERKKYQPKDLRPARESIQKLFSYLLL